MAQKVKCDLCGYEFEKIAVTNYSLAECECIGCGETGHLTCEDAWDCKDVNERVAKLLSSYEDEEFEALWDEIEEQMRTDDEPPRKVVYHLLRVFLNGNVDDALIAMCGWSLDTLLNRVSASFDEEEEVE